jgi:predicted TIM-barrel enzyme
VLAPACRPSAKRPAGIDLIVIYNSGRYRMAGRGSLAGLLAYGNANDIVVEMAREVLPVVQHTPVLAGVNGTDPFMIRSRFLRELIELGFSGIQNFPTVGLIDGTFRANLEETGMGYGLEVELVREARSLDLLTTPYVFNEQEARAMAEAGADIVVCHMGLTTGGCDRRGDGAEARRLRRADQHLPGRGAGRQTGSCSVPCGPIATPETRVHPGRCPERHGFYAPVMERLPTGGPDRHTRRFMQISVADCRMETS